MAPLIAWLTSAAECVANGALSFRSTSVEILQDLRARLPAAQHRHPPVRGPAGIDHAPSEVAPSADALDTSAGSRRLAIALAKAMASLPPSVVQDLEMVPPDTDSRLKARRRRASLILFIETVRQLEVRDLSGLLKLFPWLFDSAGFDNEGDQ